MPEAQPQETQPLPEAFRVEIADLSTTGRDDILEAFAADPGMSQDEAEALVHNTQAADEARDNFDALQKDQEAHMEAGDWEGARDRAHDAEYEMREVEDLGGHADAQILEAETDQHEIDEAIQQHDAAQTASVDAADFAAHGMNGAAEVYSQSAGEHAATAVDSAAAAAPNEYNADHLDAGTTATE